MSKALAITILAVLLGGCTARAVPAAGLIVPPDYSMPGPGAPSSRQCSNSGLDRFRGQVVTSALAAEMMRVSGAGTIRWVQPGMMVTMEFSPERLTVQLRAGNVIDRASCG